MRVYIKRHAAYAGKWIYEGYRAAWLSLGYDAKYYSNLSEISGRDYYLMATDADVTGETVSVLHNASKVFLHIQPNSFPLPWGSHPNFVSLCAPDMIQQINQMEHVVKWCFAVGKFLPGQDEKIRNSVGGDLAPRFLPDLNREKNNLLARGSGPRTGSFHHMWSDVVEIPLAFDSINYKPIEDHNFCFDLCFVGGWADNGFNEKKAIMMKHFAALKNSGLKCGIFINRNISHDIENKILYNSKVALNIHDSYQRILGFDTNERTFKSLGLTGTLVSDKIDQIANLELNASLFSSPKEMLAMIDQYLEMPSAELQCIKQKNRENIIENHSYMSRVKQLLEI